MTRWVGGGPPGPITANFYYDGAGNMTSVTGTEFGGNWTMTYDDESRLKTVASPLGSETFTYNALGQRMKLSVNYVVTRYVYDGDRVLEETNDAGTVQARYTTAAGSYYAPLLHIWRVTDSLSRFPMYDLTGSVRGLLDAAGGVTDTYTLEAFGKQRASAGTTPNPYRFGGAWGYINGVSGLQQLGARFYWPEIGRFIQQDPSGDGMNWYAYAGNNPVTGVDPRGLYDILLPYIEADVATPWGGITWSGGIVIDTDALAHSGVFSSIGPARGLSLGLGIGVGGAKEIEGYAESYDLNAAVLSGMTSHTPPRGEKSYLFGPYMSGWAVTGGPGAGVSYSETITETTTVEHMWGQVKCWWKRLRDSIGI
jgi:RHS repeat-associated protein